MQWLNRKVQSDKRAVYTDHIMERALTLILLCVLSAWVSHSYSIYNCYLWLTETGVQIVNP